MDRSVLPGRDRRGEGPDRGAAMSRLSPCVDDSVIEAAIAQSGLIPEFFEWHGDKFVTLRLQVEGGPWFAESRIDSGMGVDDVAAIIDRMARRLKVRP